MRVSCHSLAMFWKLSRSAMALACRNCRLWSDGSIPLGQHALRLLAAFSGILERYGGVFPETEQLALAVETVSHPPELASIR